MGLSGPLVARVRRRRRRRSLRRRKRVKHALPAVKHGIMIGRSSQQMSEPVSPQVEHIPASMRLERRPTRDDREDERMQLRTADGHVVALVERVDPANLLN